MQFGKSVVGALIGGAVGIAALIGIHMLTGWDKAWLAILVALLTGLGVRWVADTKGHASYARGALTALVAILAFLVWYPIQAKITVRGSVAKPIVADPTALKSLEAKQAAAEEPGESAEATASPAPAEPAPEVASREADEGPSLVPGALPRPHAQQFSTWDFLWLCIAGLIAYELGRGTASTSPASATAGSPDAGPPVTDAHPSPPE